MFNYEKKSPQYFSPFGNQKRLDHHFLQQQVLAQPFQDLYSLLASLQLKLSTESDYLMLRSNQRSNKFNGSAMKTVTK